MNIIEQANYYIWWLRNCSLNTPLSIIKKDVDSLIFKLNALYLETGETCEECTILQEFQLFGHSPSYWEFAMSIRLFSPLLRIYS